MGLISPNFIKLRKQARVGTHSMLSKIFHDNSYRPPMVDKVSTNDMHWREMELTGFVGNAEWAKRSFVHIIKGLFYGTCFLVSVSICRIRAGRTQLYDTFDEQNHQAKLTMLRYWLGCMGVALVFFSLAPIKKFSYAILNKIAIRKNQSGILSHVIEYNISRFLLTAMLAYYNLTMDDYFGTKWESLLLAGGLGAIFGGVFAGVVLSRYAASVGTGGGLGVVAGFTGYNSLKDFGTVFKIYLLPIIANLEGEDENRDFLLDANRVFYTPIIRSVSFVAAFTAFVLFLGAFFTPCGMGPTYGLVTGGLLTGAALRTQIEPHEQTIDGIVQRICEQIYPDVLTCSFNMSRSDELNAVSNVNASKNLISNSAS